MAIDSFQGSSISSTYNRLVQTDGTVFADGTGSVIDLINITSSTAVSASYALTASYAVSASYEIIKEESSSFADTASYVNPLVQDVSIRGTGTTSATTSLKIENADSTRSVVVLGNGYVGIGTNTPSTFIHSRPPGINSSGYEFIFSTSRDGGGSDIKYLRSSGTELTWRTNSAANFSIIAYTSAGAAHATTTYALSNKKSWKVGGHKPDLSFRINDGTFGVNDKFVIVTESYNVGIGNTNPQYKLDVSGSGNFTDNLTVTGSLTISGSSTFTNIGPANFTGSVGIYKSGSTVLNVEGSSGQLFSITDSLTGSLFSVNTVAGLPVVEAFSDNTVNIGKFGIYPIKVVDSGSSAVITGSLFGTASYVPTLDEVTTAGNTTTNAISITTADTYKFSLYEDGGNRELHLGVGNGYGGSARFRYIESSTIKAEVYLGNDLIFDKKGTGGTIFRDNAVEKARFANSTGNLLIGTTTDSGYKLQVNGDIKISGNDQIIYGPSNTEYIRFYTPGNFLILSGQNGVRIDGRLRAGGLYESNDTAALIFYPNYDGIDKVTRFYNTFVHEDSSDPFVMSRNDLEFRIDSNNDSTTSAFKFTKDTGTELIRINETGNIGIGTTTPSYPLDVSGSGRFTDGLTITGSTNLYKSGSTVLDVQGSQGQLFSVIDELSGSLMSVNDISGLPILEVFSDDRVEMGTYGSPGLVVTGSDVTIGNVLTLTPQDPLPTGVPTGSFAVSSSVPPKPYFWDGSSWNALY